MPEITPTRRTVIRTAAWTVPAVTVATAAPAFAGSPTDPVEPVYTTVTRDFVFESTNALGTFDIPVQVVAENVPVTTPAGVTLRQIQTRSTVTIPANVAEALWFVYLARPAKIGGTSASTTTFSGALGDSSRTTELTIAPVAYAGSGPLVTIAAGAADALTIPAGASGQVTLSIARPVSTLAGFTGDDTPTGSTYPSTLTAKAGQDYTLATFAIG